MSLERRSGAAAGPPFPIHAELVGTLLAAHRPSAATARDPVVAQVLGTCAAYAYSDTETVATMMSRLGMSENACVQITQNVDAMFVHSTAYLVQSRCGRVVVLGYRGTEPATIGSWLGDADVGDERMRVGAESFAVHSGFHRNLRATRFAVIEELRRALAGRSLADPDRPVDHPMEALFVTGHSLGGAMALLFALSLLGGEVERPVLERLRAVYTFGQPLATCEPLPAAAAGLERRVFRHVMARDPIPGLPGRAWGRLTHFGQEYRHASGEWRRSEKPVAQLASIRRIPGSLLTFFAPSAWRRRARYSIAEHAPHHYLAALRPRGAITELGDLE